MALYTNGLYGLEGFLDIEFWDERSAGQIFILLFCFGNIKTKTKTHIVVEKKGGEAEN